jgi:hypothetical protein
VARPTAAAERTNATRTEGYGRGGTSSDCRPRGIRQVVPARCAAAPALAGIGITTAAIGRSAGAQRAQANSVHRAAHVGGGGGARMARPMSGMGGGVRSAGTGSGRISPRASSITSIGVRPSRLTVHSPAMGA